MSSSTEVAKITRPAAVYWNGGVAHAFKGFAMTIGVIGTAAGIGTFYWLVIKKKRDIDKLQAAYWNPEAQKKKFDNMNKMKVFTCTQLDKYEWE